ncbi:hypothetical protein ACP70R_021325 [Stipagrostis hirtigluma subsp. patula]
MVVVNALDGDAAAAAAVVDELFGGGTGVVDLLAFFDHALKGRFLQPLEVKAAGGRGEEEGEEELEWLSNKDAFPAVETMAPARARPPPGKKGEQRFRPVAACNAAGRRCRHCEAETMAPEAALPPKKRGRVPRRAWSPPSSPPRAPAAKVAGPCRHCGTEETPQWREGPEGHGTLCNACGVRYKSGRLVPEYRPAKSPTFSPELHSNSHRRILKMRLHREEPTCLPPVAQVTDLDELGFGEWVEGRVQDGRIRLPTMLDPAKAYRLNVVVEPYTARTDYGHQLDIEQQHFAWWVGQALDLEKLNEDLASKTIWGPSQQPVFHYWDTFDRQSKAISSNQELYNLFIERYQIDLFVKICDKEGYNIGKRLSSSNSNLGSSGVTYADLPSSSAGVGHADKAASSSGVGNGADAEPAAADIVDEEAGPVDWSTLKIVPLGGDPEEAKGLDEDEVFGALGLKAEDEDEVFGALVYKSQWPQVDKGFKLLPPDQEKRGVGRQRKNRFPSCLEKKGKGNKTGIKRQVTCKKCGERGHRESSAKCRFNGTKKRPRAPKKKPEKGRKKSTEEINRTPKRPRSTITLQPSNSPVTAARRQLDLASEVSLPATVQLNYLELPGPSTQASQASPPKSAPERQRKKLTPRKNK